MSDPQKVRDVSEVLAEVRVEVSRAMDRHGSMKSAHEAWAVIREEVDELWEEVKANRGYELSALEGATQVAAMAVRYIVDLRNRKETS